jgi:DNA-binding ferritin-like protein (Dps family)
MKRVLDYAAENGYDTVAITPGAEQAKRYDLSKQIDSVVVSPFRAERGEYTLQAIGKDGKTVIDKNDVQLKDLDDYIGKDLADKARQQMVDFGKSNLTGVDLQVGGEGMKGFYDKILPDYLNNYGKKYGAQMGQMRSRH